MGRISVFLRHVEQGRHGCKHVLSKRTPKNKVIRHLSSVWTFGERISDKGCELVVEYYREFCHGTSAGVTVRLLTVIDHALSSSHGSRSPARPRH